MMTRRNTPRVSFIGFGEAGQAIASGLARRRHRAHRRLGHPVSGGRRRAAEGGRRQHGRAARAFGGRRRRRDRHDHFRGDGGIEPGGRPFGRAASQRRAVLSRHQFGLARPQAGNREAARRARPLCRRGGDRADPSGAPQDAAVDRRSACRSDFAAAPRVGDETERRRRRYRPRRRHQDDPQRDDQGHRGADAGMLPRGQPRRRAGGSHRVDEEQLSRRSIGPRSPSTTWSAWPATASAAPPRWKSRPRPCANSGSTR